jgi:hypothetical protein
MRSNWGMLYIVGKILLKAIRCCPCTFFKKLICKKYERPKFWDNKSPYFGTPTLESHWKWHLDVVHVERHKVYYREVSQPYFGQVWGWSPTLGKSWDWSPPGLPKTQKTIWKTKTPRIGVFLVSLQRSWNVDIENSLAFSIWTSAAQVMGKRRAGSQTGSLTPDH